jgi:hypothetical protein
MAWQLEFALQMSASPDPMFLGFALGMTRSAPDNNNIDLPSRSARIRQNEWNIAARLEFKAPICAAAFCLSSSFTIGACGEFCWKLNEIKANLFAPAANTIHVYFIIYILGVFAARRSREQRVFPPIDLSFMALWKIFVTSEKHCRHITAGGTQSFDHVNRPKK